MISKIITRQTVFLLAPTQEDDGCSNKKNLKKKKKRQTAVSDDVKPLARTNCTESVVHKMKTYPTLAYKVIKMIFIICQDETVV